MTVEKLNVVVQYLVCFANETEKKTATNTLNERKKISRAHATVDALMLESPSNYQMHN